MNIKDYTWVYISRGKHSKSAKIKNNKRHFLSRYSPYLKLVDEICYFVKFEFPAIQL